MALNIWLPTEREGLRALIRKKPSLEHQAVLNRNWIRIQLECQGRIQERVHPFDLDSPGGQNMRIPKRWP